MPIKERENAKEQALTPEPQVQITLLLLIITFLKISLTLFFVLKNPFNSMNIVSGMIPETPLRQVMPPTMNMGGQATGVPGLTPDMSGAEMMDTIEDNPGITAFFPRRLGMIDGPGGPKDDKIPAMLSDGEFVFTAKAVENAGGPRAMYNMMNKLDPESSKGRGII